MSLCYAAERWIKVAVIKFISVFLFCNKCADEGTQYKSFNSQTFEVSACSCLLSYNLKYPTILFNVAHMWISDKCKNTEVRQISSQK